MQPQDNRSGGTNPRTSNTNISPQTWTTLLPVTVATFGSPEQPVERLMALQSAFAKGVQLMASVGQFQLRPSVRELLRFAFDGWHATSWHR